MTLFLLGIAIFFGIHLLPMLVSLRKQLIDRMGERGYKTAFSVISAIGFVFMLQGWKDLPYIPIYEPPAFGLALSKFIMLLAVILLVASKIPCRIKQMVKHPMLLAIILWASVHLITNGDQASLILFGAFLAWSVLDWVSVVTRQPAAEPVEVKARNDYIVIAVGVLVYIAIYFLHVRFIAPLG